MSRHPRTLALAALLAAAGASQAATFVASGRTHTLPGGADDVQRQFGNAPVAIEVNGSGSQSPGGGGAIIVDALGRASADMGGVHLWASTMSSIDSPGLYDMGVASVSASASMGDRFTIAASALPLGSSFSALVGFSIDAGLAGEAVGGGSVESRASWSARMVMHGPTGQSLDVSAQLGCYASNQMATYNCFGDSAGTRWTPVTFTVGGSYSWSIQGDISSSVNAVRASTATSTVDLSHTLAWAGMKDIRDAQGQPLTGISAISDSTGFDYVNGFAPTTPPVPEPGTWALMLGGLAGMGAIARRRRT